MILIERPRSVSLLVLRSRSLARVMVLESEIIDLVTAQDIILEIKKLASVFCNAEMLHW